MGKKRKKVRKVLNLDFPAGTAHEDSQNTPKSLAQHTRRRERDGDSIKKYSLKVKDSESNLVLLRFIFSFFSFENSFKNKRRREFFE